MSDCLEVMPLGGLGEFGMNCAALRFGSDMILIDAGVTFPGNGRGNDLGVEVIVPDISFLKENQEQLRAILLTHGHEDHAGGLAYLIGEIPVPVYGSRLTLGLVTERLKEHKLEDSVPLIPIEARQHLEFGSLSVEPLHMTHSFPDAFCFAISSPVGSIIWTGDFKLDQKPIDGKISDLARLSEYAQKGVLALFSDSTNSRTSGQAASESTMYEALRNLFQTAQKKIIVACFASSIHRIQVILDLALESGRKVVPVGRSMISNIKTATQLDYLHFPEDLLISPREVKEFSADELIVLATGSQGEPRSALSRMSRNEFKTIEVEEGDLVILSARIIPGNEKPISNLINHFYRRGARVYDSRHSLIHSSGHGLRDDLKQMIKVTRPKFFVPIHGEFGQLKNHAELAQDQGIPPENILIIENGDSLRLLPDSIEVAGKIKVGKRFIDEGSLEEVQEEVLRDRRYLSEDGFVVLVLRVDRVTGDLLGKPELVSRGFVLMQTSADLVEAAQDEVSSLVAQASEEDKQDEEVFKDLLRKGLRRFLRKQTGKRPIILPVIMEG